MPANQMDKAMRYRIEISAKAREQLRAMPKELRRNIGERMEMMRDDLRGDVLKLKDKGGRYRLRVGSHRVLFVLVGEAIQVYAVKDRKEAYE
jgi:mRNA-degrading endonuclease RelE of RelBE toxin-antitoxin system